MSNQIIPHPIREAINAAVVLCEDNMNGQLKHAHTAAFSSIEAYAQNVEMAGNYAKAFLLLCQARELIPATLEVRG